MRWTGIWHSKPSFESIGIKYKAFKSLSVSMLLLLLCACSSERSSLGDLPVGSTVLAFGDSLTAGYGADPAQSYPDILQNLAVLNVINAGVSGELSAEGLRRLPSLLTQHRPNLVILCHGGNDLLRSTGRGSAKNNVTQMIDLIKASGAEVLLLGVPQPGIFLSTAEFYDEIAEETAVAYIPDLMKQVLSDAALKSDPAHPNAAGYTVIATEVHDFLLNAGAL